MSQQELTNRHITTASKTRLIDDRDDNEDFTGNTTRSGSQPTFQHHANHQQQPAQQQHSITLPLLSLAVAASLGMFSFGYEIVVLNAPGAVVEQWINTSYARRGATWRNGTNAASVPGLPPSTTRFLYSLAAAMFAAGGMLGALNSGPLAERIGRRGSQMASAVLGMIAAPLMALSVYVWCPELFIIGRFLVGITNGASTVLSAMYIIESSPLSIRGAIANVNNFACVIGFILAQVLGLPILLGTASLWPVLFFIAACAPALQFVLLFISPETPRHLYLTLQDHEQATKALQKLRRQNDVSAELAELEQEAQELCLHSLPSVTIRQLVTQRRYALPLLVAIVIHFSQVFSGSNGILGYSSILFQQAGMSPENASYANLAVGAILFVMAFVTISLIDLSGRKVLLLVGVVGMIVFGLLITLFSALPHHVHDSAANNGFNIANIISVLGFTVFYAIGPAPLPWIVMTELFSQGARGPAASIASLVNWIGQFITFLAFPAMQLALGDYVYLPFVGLLVIFLMFLLKYMPETKGRTFDQISAMFGNY